MFIFAYSCIFISHNEDVPYLGIKTLNCFGFFPPGNFMTSLMFHRTHMCLSRLDGAHCGNFFLLTPSPTPNFFFLFVNTENSNPNKNKTKIKHLPEHCSVSGFGPGFFFGSDFFPNRTDTGQHAVALAELLLQARFAHAQLADGVLHLLHLHLHEGDDVALLVEFPQELG